MGSTSQSCSRCWHQHPHPERLTVLLYFAVALSALLRADVAQGISELCFEKISDTVAIYLQQIPGTNRALVATQKGKIYLKRLPAVGSRVAMRDLSLYLDLSDRVKYDNKMGLHSFALHPQFARNGRIFVTYTCDSTRLADCKAPFGCRPSGACSPGSAGDPRGKYTTSIAEYQTAGSPLQANQLRPKEARRILAFARPHENHYGGHIFFDKTGKLMFTSGDGGSQNDPWRMAQNERSMFGKILRLDVDKRSGSSNYSVPANNPFKDPMTTPSCMHWD